MKNIILCADDYGQNQFISQAIIALLEKGCLSATSCMTTADDWPEHAKWLQIFKNQVDVGLHFNLTEGTALSGNHDQFSSLSRLLWYAHARRLNTITIEAELHAQLDAFEEAMGQLPHFIDGHQHVHQLPQVRNALFKVYEARLRQSSCYLRCVYTPKMFFQIKDRQSLKACLVQVLSGAAGFKKELERRAILHNSSFAGIYSFTDSADFTQIFPRFLHQINSGGIIMCHPGLLNEQIGEDLIAKARYHEFSYFNSEQFKWGMQSAGVVLTRFKEK